MSAEKNSMFIAAIIVTGAVSATLGMVVRDRVDLPIRDYHETATMDGTRMASAQDPKEAIDIPEREYFEQMVEMLKQGYVEPITDDQKLVSGAVRGMVVSLEDMNSLFMDKDEFRVFQNAREGQYEGIGADLLFVMPPKSTDPNDEGRIPRLAVAAVTPGGPAEKAGVKQGDIVDTVDGRWVFNLEDFEAFRKLQQKFTAKQISVEVIQKARNELRAKTEHGLMPTKAKDKLIVGMDGTVKVTWLRGDKRIETTLTKGPSRAEAVTSAGGALQVRLMPGVGVALSSRLPASGVATLDLRNNPFADVATINEALTSLAAAGSYGSIANARGASKPLSIATGSKSSLKYKLIVDKSTRGGAAILAQALSSKGLATIEGSPSTDLSAIEVNKLPDGTGFTLTRGYYKPEASK
jgi:carboxyl-terminal processing protease